MSRHGDKAPQVPPSEVVVLGDPLAGTVVVDGHPLTDGEPCPPAWGLDGLVDLRLRQVVAVLAVRSSLGRAWVTAEELAGLLGQGVRGLRKALERAVRPHEDALAPEERPPRLVDYAPKEGGPVGWAGGRSRGPYRLGRLRAKVRTASNTERSRALSLPGSVVEVEQLVEHADRLASQRLLGVAREDLSTAWIGALGLPSADQSAETLARVGLRLASLHMELGRSGDAIRVGETVGRVLRSLPRGRRLRAEEGQALLVQAHALGQLDDVRAAHARAREALAVLSVPGVPESERDHAEGVVGQYGSASSEGAARRSTRRILSALAASERDGRGRWVVTWQCRLVQDAMRRRSWAEAERHAAAALESSRHLAHSLPQDTDGVLMRVLAEFFVRTGQWDLAPAWVRSAEAHGVELDKLHHQRLVKPLVEALEAHEKGAPTLNS